MCRSFRSFMVITALLAASLGPEVSVAQAPTNVRVITDSIAQDVYLLRVTSDQGPILAQVTVFATEGQALLIDTHAGQAAPLLRAALNTLGVEQIGTAINSHWHPDHNLGNAFWRASGATVIAHQRTRSILATPQLARGLTGPGSEFSRPAVGGAGLPGVTFADSLDLYLGDDRVHVFNPGPSHTNGDAVVWIPSRRVLQLGDLYWPGHFPSVDTDNGGSAEGLVEAIGRILRWLPEDAVVLSGHAAPTGKEALRGYHEMLAQTVGQVRTSHQAGKSQSEIVEAGLEARWRSWASPLVPENQWIRLILRSFGHG